MEINAITTEIAKLSLKPGDILVVKFPQYMKGRLIERFLPTIRNNIPPEISILFFHGDIELTVVSKDDTPPAE